MFADLETFMESGRLWWQGIYSSLYPLPFVMIWSLLARLPQPAVIALFVAACIAIMIALFKWRALLWMWYIPIVAAVTWGQLSLVWLWLLARAMPLTLALLTLKPYLFPLAIPALIERPQLRKPFALWCVVLYLPAFVVRPAWPVEWLSQAFGKRILQEATTSLWAVAWLVPVALAALALARRLNWKTICTSFNPAMHLYDYTILAGSSLWIIPASWIAWMWMQSIGGARDVSWPMAIVGIIYALVSEERWPHVQSQPAS